MTNLYVSDVVFFACTRRFDDYINDESAHPISGVLFVAIKFSAIS